MKKREFIFAGMLSLVLGFGVILGLGGSRGISFGPADDFNPISNPSRVTETPSTKVPETPEIQKTPISRILEATDASNNTSIAIWQGRTQNFSFLGNPQEAINILGNVFDPDGISSLSFSLNDGPEMRLCTGKEELPSCNASPRLVSQGDFNIEINSMELNVGQNSVLIKAVDELDNQSTELVTVQYSGRTTWPLPYRIDWNATTRITDVAQIVDGKWTLEAESIRPETIGYDRLIAIGDISWVDYEVTVPITIHDFPYSGNGAVGIMARWGGHSTVSNEQPGTVWWRFGAYGHYSNLERETGKPYLAMSTDRYEIEKDYGVNLDLDVTYFFKMRVETESPDQGGFYSFKVWKADQPEPSQWDFQKQDEQPNQPLYGSILLVAHRADASFGDVTIMPLEVSPVIATANEFDQVEP